LRKDQCTFRRPQNLWHRIAGLAFELKRKNLSRRQAVQPKGFAWQIEEGRQQFEINTMEYQIAQINVARMIGVNIEDPIMKEFVENLDRVNELAENSPGFVWRLKDDSNNASNFNPFNDEQVIINVSVWEDIESLENFTYKTFHTDFLKRRKEWFFKYGKAHFALWWIKAGNYPSIEDSMERLKCLQLNGASKKAFNFKDKFAQPEY